MNEWEWQLLEEKTPAERVCVSGVEVKKGDRVRLRPRAGGDIFDLALDGQTAVIEAIEQDYEGKLHLAVVLEDDPGRDLGMLRQPGHRFFFSPEEAEPLAAPSILIAGIGNIFLGDDGFGVEVIRHLAGRQFPESVRVADFGIRGYDLAYALLDGHDVTILVDAVGRGGTPGTLYVIEPDVTGNSVMDAHAMNPVSVLQLASSMGPVRGRILLVGCEPATLGGEEGHMGLSEAVLASVEEAARLVEDLVAKLLRGNKVEEALSEFSLQTASGGKPVSMAGGSLKRKGELKCSGSS
jgi:hydrogenase maturation protease